MTDRIPGLPQIRLCDKQERRVWHISFLKDIAKTAKELFAGVFFDYAAATEMLLDTLETNERIIVELSVKQAINNIDKAHRYLIHYDDRYFLHKRAIELIELDIEQRVNILSLELSLRVALNKAQSMAFV